MAMCNNTPLGDGIHLIIAKYGILKNVHRL